MSKQNLDRSSPVQRSRVVAPPEKSARSGSDALLLGVLLMFSMLISAGLLRNQLVTLMPRAGQTGIRTGLTVLFYGVEIIALSYIAYRHRAKFTVKYRLRHEPDVDASDADSSKIAGIASSAALIAGFLIALRALGIGWALLTQNIGWHPPQTNGLVELFGNSGFGLILAVVSVVLLAPFVEELIFRGVLLEWFSSAMPGWAAVLLSSLAFSLYHLSWWAFSLNLVLGMATGYLARKCTTLWPAIVLHAFYNATLVAAAFYVASKTHL